MPVLLLCRTGDDAGLAHLVEGGRCLIGRGEGCQLSLLHPQLSREHALIRAESGGLVAEDLGSSNGTEVNGERLEPSRPQPLAHLDRLSLGPELEFVVLDLERVPRTEVVAAHVLDSGGERVPLQLGDNTIGSDGESDLIVTDPAVSPLHAHLELSASGLMLRRERSARPVRVNGDETASARLSDGDLLTLSPHSAFRIEILSGLADPPVTHEEERTRPEPVAKGEDVAAPPKAEEQVEGDATATLEKAEITDALRRANERRQEELARRVRDRREAQVAGTAGPGTSAFEYAEDQEGGTAKNLRRTWSAKPPATVAALAKTAELRAVRREAAVRFLFRLNDGAEEQAALLREGRHVVGRQEGCRVVLSDPTVSREHAEVRVGPQGIKVKDLGSGNGTFKDGERVQEVTLQDGDTIRFGRVECRIEVI